MSSDLIRHAAEIVEAYVSNNEMPAKDVAGLLSDVFTTLSKMSGTSAADSSKPALAAEPANVDEGGDDEEKKEPARRGAPTGPRAERKKIEPVISIESSVRDDAILCLVCGKACKALKGHLTRSHAIDVDEYRRRYGLERDYPMVAPNYSERRRQLAIDAGLGEKLRAARKKV